MHRILTLCLLLGGSRLLHAQSVQPVISEYRDHAAGSFQVINSSAVPMAVVLEPKSFAITPEGEGIFRDLDPGIQLQLSATSMRLEPLQSATIFYKVSAGKAPAWLSIYAAFSRVTPNEGLNVKVLLPHTVYVYQHEPLARDQIQVESVHYDALLHKVFADIINTGERAGRAESVEAHGDRTSASASGFPVLPHATRRLAIEWTSAREPRTIEIDFARFSIKAPVGDQTLSAANLGATK